jgi:hypothetical protein
MQLEKYDAACRALANAKVVDEAKQIRNTADAMRTYARLAHNKDLEIDATEIRIRAERRLGELIAAQKATVGLAKGSDRGGRKSKFDGSRKEPSNAPPTLKDAGIDKKLSASAQRLANVPAAKFERLVAAWRDRVRTKSERVSTDLQRVDKPRSTAMDEDEDRFHPDVATARVVHAIRSIAADWPSTESVTPLVETLRREADRLERRQERQAS